MKELFRKISNRVSYATGTVYSFAAAFLLVIVWASTGPLFNFSNTWQLVINTGTTIGTFLMVFLIQNTQNRDSKAMQLKLDEIIRASRARDSFMDLEDLTDAELSELALEFSNLRQAQTVKSHAMRKLHTKIETVHKQRSGISAQASHVFEALFVTSTPSGKDK